MADSSRVLRRRRPRPVKHYPRTSLEPPAGLWSRTQPGVRLFPRGATAAGQWRNVSRSASTLV